LGFGVDGMKVRLFCTSNFPHCPALRQAAGLAS
jgi:hypothetical protein